MIRGVPFALLYLSSVVAAQQTSGSVLIPRDPTEFHGLRIDGTTNFARTKRVLNELTWHKSVEKAAAAAVEADRPIVLVQALGEIKGFC